MPVKKGDFILVEYVGKVKETGEVFDTTQEEVAKEERLYKEGEIYEPKLVVVGEGSQRKQAQLKSHQRRHLDHVTQRRSNWFHCDD